MGKIAGKKILIIDNDEFLAKLFQFRLEAAGFWAATVSAPSEVDKTIASMAPDLVIIDLMFQGADAYEIIRHLADKKHGGRTAVIALSRFREEGCDARVMGLGARACLVTTECTPLQLVNHVKDVLHKL